MNSKISSLVISAHNDLGMDSQLKVNDCDIDAEVFYTDSIFLPAVVIITNALYFRATQDTLIKLNGVVRKSTIAPFGLRLDGDIDLSNTEKPLGYIEQCIKTTLRIIQPMYKNDLLENFSLHLLHEVIHEFKDNDEIPDKMYIKQDLLLGTV